MPSDCQKKLPFFIETYPDELWCSVVGRLHARLGFSWNSMCRWIYDSSRGPQFFALPSRFRRLVSVLPSYLGISAEQLISAHTLLPLYRPFLPHEQLHWWEERMAGSNKYIIFPEPRWEKTSLKYCRECA